MSLLIIISEILAIAIYYLSWNMIIIYIFYKKKMLNSVQNWKLSIISKKDVKANYNIINNLIQFLNVSKIYSK